MAYATAADLIERFSAEEIAQRAAPEGVRVTGDLLQLTVSGGDRSAYAPDQIAAADAALVRIGGVLDDASADIDSYLSQRYEVPLSPVPRVLVRIACDLARYYLYDDAVTKDSVIDMRYNAAIKMLGQISTGDIKLGEEPEPPVNPEAGATFTSSGRTFTGDGLADYLGRFL